MTLEDAKHAYQNGLITATGLVYYAVKTSRKDGHRLRIKNIKSFCSGLGISPRIYYLAISKLRKRNQIEWIVTGGMDLWVPEHPPSGNNEQGSNGHIPLSMPSKGSSDFDDQTITVCDQTFTGCDQTCSGSDQTFTDCDQTCSGSDQTFTATPAEPLCSNDSSSPSIIPSIPFQSPHNPYSIAPPEPGAPPTQEEESVWDDASLTEERKCEPEASDTLSGSLMAKESMATEKQKDLTIGQYSAPPKPVYNEHNVKRSGLSNIEDGANQLLSSLLEQGEVKAVAPPYIPMPKPIAKSERGWICPGTSEERREFLEWDANRLFAAKICSRIEAKSYAVATWNKHQEKATLLFEEWQKEKQRQAQPAERRKAEHMPNFKLESKRDVAERIAEYHRLGEEEFLKQKSWHQRWLDEHARKYNLI